jgi:hypothetical protein
MRGLRRIALRLAAAVCCGCVAPDRAISPVIFGSASRLTEEDAIALVEQTHSELAGYPAPDAFPPTQINAERDESGWYLAFVQQGSGRPILGARCFFVPFDARLRPQGSVVEIGSYIPAVSDTRRNIHPRDCTPFDVEADPPPRR